MPNSLRPICAFFRECAAVAAEEWDGLDTYYLFESIRKKSGQSRDVFYGGVFLRLGVNHNWPAESEQRENVGHEVISGPGSGNPTDAVPSGEDTEAEEDDTELWTDTEGGIVYGSDGNPITF